MRKVVWGAVAVFAVMVLLLAGCSSDSDDTTTTTAAPTTTTTAAPTTTTTVVAAPELAIPFLAMWEGSGHNDATAEAFIHWDEDDPAVVPASCAKCHSTFGYEDFLGVDGSAFGTVDADHEIGSTIQCVACHNAVTSEMTSVVMPSGIELTGLGDESRCMQCHQGRQSGVSVMAAIDAAGVDDDAVSEDLGFLNIHYFAAAATKYGTEAKGGFEYAGNTYDAFFAHVDGYETCIGCHDPHTLELKVDECSVCHTGVASADDLKDVRMPSSAVDYDGDGDIEEGVYYEIEGLQAKLYEALQAYGSEKIGSAVVYDSHSYPYFFIDTNGDGEAGADEANYGNRYATWTPRFLKAAYNYQVSLKDPGAFAHGGKYIMQLLTDSIEDLNSVLASPVAMEGTHRIDHGHFAGSEEAFRHWDEDPAVPASCARCHSADGLPLYLAEGVNISTSQSNGFQCVTCHTSAETFALPEVGAVEFPSGAEIDSGDNNMNLCINCHQGRSSTVSVDGALAGKADDTVDTGIRFINIHYFAAGATIFGTEVQGAYEYSGKTYNGRFAHVAGFDSCTGCHDAHELEVQTSACAGCHGTDVVDAIRFATSTDDYDGDGNVDEGLAMEIETMNEMLYAAIQAYATGNADAAAIIYDSHSYPYFFVDTNENGISDGPGEANYGNRYGTWTPSLLRAAYNYQYAAKDPGAFAHNGKYILQVLYDSIQDIGGSVAGMTRP